MILIGMLHIASLLIAYVLYLFVAVKSFSNKTPYKVLLFTNLLYIVGFILGMLWADIAWGFYLNPDIKSILSILLFIPFAAESIMRTNKPLLPVAGAALIVLNYILPTILYSIHTH